MTLFSMLDRLLRRGDPEDDRRVVSTRDAVADSLVRTNRAVRTQIEDDRAARMRAVEARLPGPGRDR